jgi:hypothetical protein
VKSKIKNSIYSILFKKVTIVSFATYLFMDENNKLDASTAFVCISLFNILKFPLSVLPWVINSLIEVDL